MSRSGLLRLVSVCVLVLLVACGLSTPVRADRGNFAERSRSPLDSPDPAYENRLETAHFILKWTNKSSNPGDNVSDPKVVKEAAAYFERAWDKLTGLFGRRPYVAPGKSKVEVIFKDLECYAFADPPEGPIELNSSVWMHMPSVRQTVAAHELFHKFQYAYGYKTRWLPQRSILWFSEGTAAWAEVFVCGRVTRNCKMEDMFMDASLDLYRAEDMSLPFWIYFVSGNSTTPKDQLMVRYFELYEKTGNAKDALYSVVRDGYGSVEGFFSRFDKERRSGFWQGPDAGTHPYSCILGPEGKDLVAEIKAYQERRFQDEQYQDKVAPHPPGGNSALRIPGTADISVPGSRHTR
jgi:hypothetical protein